LEARINGFVHFVRLIEGVELTEKDGAKLLPGVDRVGRQTLQPPPHILLQGERDESQLDLILSKVWYLHEVANLLKLLDESIRILIMRSSKFG
jgi:hypothetical protein